MSPATQSELTFSCPDADAEYNTTTSDQPLSLFLSCTKAFLERVEFRARRMLKRRGLSVVRIGLPWSEAVLIDIFVSRDTYQSD